MSRSSSGTTEVVSTWVVVLGSAILLAHWAAVGTAVLAVPTGPWLTPLGPTQMPPPAFTQALKDAGAPSYLNAVKLSQSYRFATNWPGQPSVFFEVRLKDPEGRELANLRFPDKDANRWVRHRQLLLARGLGEDWPIQPPAGEAVAAPHQQVETVPIWEVVGNHAFKLKTVPEHLIPRDREVESPSKWSLLLARSYARYLCRTHGAATAELIRHSRNPVPPRTPATGEPPADALEELVANFGELSGE